MPDQPGPVRVATAAPGALLGAFVAEDGLHLRRVTRGADIRMCEERATRAGVTPTP